MFSTGLIQLTFVISLCGSSFGFSCFLCSTSHEGFECLNATRSQSKPCFEGANVCVSQLLLNRTQRTTVIRFCDSRTHLHLKDGCFTDETELHGPEVECVCSQQNCNGLSLQAIENSTRQPRSSLEETDGASSIRPVFLSTLLLAFVSIICINAD